MLFQTIFFYVCAAILLYGAIRVITVKNPVFAALHLVLAFVASAGIWILLQAEFLGLVLVLVYVGAVMVLFLFVVMMIDVSMATIRERFTRHAPMGVVIALIVAIEIGWVLWSNAVGGGISKSPVSLGPDFSNTQALGMVLYTKYVYVFELASGILLIGIITAISLTMRRRPGTRHQDVDKQVKIRPEDRMRIVNMKSEEKQSPVRHDDNNTEAEE